MGGAGHLMPVLAAARALQRRGDEVLMLVPPSLTPAVADAGVEFVVGGEPPRAVVDEIWERVRQGPREQVEGLIDGELFADLATGAMIGAAQSACDRFAPALIVRESCEYATAMTAHRSGTDQAQIAISPARIEAAVLQSVSDRLERRCAGSGLAEARGVYRTALEAVTGLPARVLMTVGGACDIEALGPVADNVHIERWVSQSDALAAAHLVVCHGGSGTTYGALAAGVPLVICPLFADQTANAIAVEQAGAGTIVRSRHGAGGAVASLDAGDVPALRQAITSTLAAHTVRDAARRIAGDMARAPTLEQVIDDMITAGASSPDEADHRSMEA